MMNCPQAETRFRDTANFPEDLTIKVLAESGSRFRRLLRYKTALQRGPFQIARSQSVVGSRLGSVSWLVNLACATVLKDRDESACSSPD